MPTTMMPYGTSELQRGGSRRGFPGGRAFIKRFALRGRDPAQADENLYRYCENMPTEATDPSGMAAAAAAVPRLTNATWLKGSPGVKWTGVAFVINYELTDDLRGAFYYQAVAFTFTAKDKNGKVLPKYSQTGSSVDLGKFNPTQAFSDEVNCRRALAFETNALLARSDESVCSMQVGYEGKWRFYKDTLKIAKENDPNTLVDYNPKTDANRQVIGTLMNDGKPVPQAPLSNIVRVDPGEQAALYEFSWTSALTLDRNKPGSKFQWSGQTAVTFNIPQNQVLATKLSMTGKAWNLPDDDRLHHSWNKK